MNHHPPILPAPWDRVVRQGHHMYELQKWHDLYKAHRGFIIGTGPSLRQEDEDTLAKLSSEYTFGVNLILKATLPFAPSMLGIMLQEWQWVNDLGVDWLVDQLKGTRKELPVIRVIFHERPLDDLHAQGWWYVPLRVGKRPEDKAFGGLGSYLRGVAFGHSVIISAIQFCCFLGFDPIYLLGCDATSSGHAYVDDPRLDARGDQLGFREAARTSEAAMQAAGRTLVDLTRGGLLPVTRGDLNEVLSHPCRCQARPGMTDSQRERYVAWGKQGAEARRQLRARARETAEASEAIVAPLSDDLDPGSTLEYVPPAQPSYECEICGKAFWEIRGLRGHSNAHLRRGKAKE